MRMAAVSGAAVRTLAVRSTLPGTNGQRPQPGAVGAVHYTSVAITSVRIPVVAAPRSRDAGQSRQALARPRVGGAAMQ